MSCICSVTGLTLILLLVIQLLPFASTGAETGKVVVYTSQDQVYAEPILQAFTAQTGVKVLPVYDSEAVKTVGLVNRLIAEKNRPRCDLFWNNEELRTRQLQARGVLRETNGWGTFGFRSRRLVVNTNLLSTAKVPHTLTALTNRQYHGKVALAYPLFGTTSTHFLALRQLWGETGWRNWCRALQANRPFVVDGNSVVVKLVAKGEAIIGLTDSDDVFAGQREHLPISSVTLEEDGFLIRNTVAVIAHAPHSVEAQMLFEYLQSTPVREQLEKVGAIESAAPVTSKSPEVNWDKLLREQTVSLEELKEIFLR